MFISEHILLNTSVSVLESAKDKPKWVARDIIFTDRALYVFAQTRNPGDTAHYINSAYERMDMTQFRAQKPMGVGERGERGPPPAYWRDVMVANGPYHMMIELLNTTNGKKRLVSLKNRNEMELFIRLFNLISSYRKYELLFNDGLLGGPDFIPRWVKTYMHHKGDMVFDQEAMKRKNLEYLIAFGTGNDSIKSLVFNEAVRFVAQAVGKKNEANAEVLQMINQIIGAFNGEGITTLKFTSNSMTDVELKAISSIFQCQPKLVHLEIVYNEISDAGLEILAKTVFKDNKQIKAVVLNNNLIGASPGARESMVTFLESFLLELDKPETLDLSCNQISDDCLRPIVKYLFANWDCHIHELNLEFNRLSNYAKRTIAQAHIRCPNQALKVQYGPLPLTQANLHVACELNSHTKKGPEAACVKTSFQQHDVVQVTIKRKPALPEQGLRYLPIMKAETDQLHKMKQRIEFMCLPDQAKRVFTEEVRDFVKELTRLEFEFPRHLMEPLFHLINEKLETAIHNEDIYNLELLLDSLAMMHARNQRAEKCYARLAEKASKVAVNLMKAINMEIHNDNELLKVLVDNLAEAKKIGMRGEVIDIATTLKALCTKLLQEMLQKTSNSDDEDDPTQQVYVLKEEDLNRSVYDPEYDKYVRTSTAQGYVEYHDAQLSSDLEPILAQHPFKADYLKMSNLNLNFTKKNHASSRRALVDEETYSLLNIYTRCSFMLTDGGTDSFKSLAFNNARDDKLLRFARLLFRYRLNLDKLFKMVQEPQANPAFATHKKRRLSYMEESSGDQLPVDTTLRIEDFPGLAIEYVCETTRQSDSLKFSAVAVTRPLTRISSVLAQTALKFSVLLCEIQKLFQKATTGPRTGYKAIRTLFETYIIHKGALMFESLADEFYLQLYRQANFMPQQHSQKELARPIFLVMALMSKYLSPSMKLSKYYQSWLEKKSVDRAVATFVKLTTANLKLERYTDRGKEGKLFVCWPPSITEIEALDKGKAIHIQVVWPSQEPRTYRVDEASTVESLLTQEIYKEKYFQKEGDKEFYWLYAVEEDETQFPKPVSKEKKILKLLYLDEKAFEDRESELSFGPAGRRSAGVGSLNAMGLGRASVLHKKRSAGPAGSGERPADKETEGSEYPGLCFYLRKRLFSSLHSIPNFKVLQNGARNFLYCQIRQDYVEREILQKPQITIEDAILIAALCLKVKYQAKLLRSKDNTLTKEIIKKNLDYCVPKSLQKDKSISRQWENRILHCFEQQNLKDLQLEEAQDQFLTLLASYKFTFASYFVVKRKPIHGSAEGYRKALLSGQGPLGQRRQFDRESVAARGSHAADLVRGEKGRRSTRKSRPGASTSDDEGEDSSDESDTDSERDEESSSLEPSNISGLNRSKEEVMRSEMLEDIFPAMQTELLLVITYETIIFVENGKRDQVLLEIKHEDLLYVMGKRDTLKIGFQTNNDQFQGHAAGSFMSRRPQMGTLPGLLNQQGDTSVDIRAAFLVSNARVVAEDIIGYCQLNLVEKTKSKEHIEIIKRNVFDMFDEDGDGERKRSTRDKDETSLPGGQTVHVDDNLLRGLTNFKASNGAQLLKEAGNRAALEIGRAAHSVQKEFESTDDHKSMVTDEDASDEDRSGSIYFGAARRNLTPLMIYEREIAKMSGHQFRFKKPDFLVYMKRHPTYVTSSRELPNRANVEVGPTPTSQKDEAFQGLANHTIGQIDEESENSHTSMYSGKSGTPAGGRKGTAQFPAIKVELFASNRSNQTEKNKYASQESAELLKELTTSPQVVASQMGSNREGIHAIPEDKREHRASAVHSEADDDGRAGEESPRFKPGEESKVAPRASTPPPKSTPPKDKPKQATLPVPKESTQPPGRKEVVSANSGQILPPPQAEPTLSKPPGTQSTQQLTVPPPQPAFSVADFMAQANKPTHLSTQPDASEAGSGSHSPSKASVQSVNAAFGNIKTDKMNNLQFEKGSKEDLKGNLSKMMASLPPPPPPI